ncbi:hypothetical protein PRUB_a4878 [Pseudoalteromonas rubra]|uniref:Uncharacterized protein n=1 Tax=Pseudoalteromonas rubra TaxID=43658 RepID=A0A8T0CBP7_9GAMM|nr:hypothetical protein [Pseudoalteromonas rubra]KAF7787482.1 hypothetical protein PRUB_a4878 [Pseudoalteromonas rubra]
MSKPTFEQFLKQQLPRQQDQDQLPEPQRDLWQGIEKAINVSSTEVPSRSPWIKLAGVAACVSAGLLSWQVIMTQPRQDTMTHMSAFFEQKKQTLLVQYEAQPALTKDWQGPLQELEEAEQAIKLALMKDPDNAALLKMLAQVYQQQLDLITKVHQPQWQQI